METHTSVYSTQKLGNQDPENQDAYAVPETANGYCETAEQRFAVADGATEALFSGPWAQLLARAWVAKSLDFEGDLHGSLATLAHEWQTALPEALDAWWAEEKLELGAFSTLCGLALWHREAGTKRWRLTAIGDSCLFHIRENALIFSGPLERAEQFGSTPFLIGSSPVKNKLLNQHIYTSDGVLFQGDELILATDALACWFLSQLERGITRAEAFAFEESPDPTSAFSDFVNAARSSGEMRNDDVTFMSVQVL